MNKLKLISASVLIIFASLTLINCGSKKEDPAPAPTTNGNNGTGTGTVTGTGTGTGTTVTPSVATGIFKVNGVEYTATDLTYKSNVYGYNRVTEVSFKVPNYTVKLSFTNPPTLINTNYPLGYYFAVPQEAGKGCFYILYRETIDGSVVGREYDSTTNDVGTVSLNDKTVTFNNLIIKDQGTREANKITISGNLTFQ